MSRSARFQGAPGWTGGLVMLLALWLACSGSTDVDSRRFPCSQDDECAAGFLCRAGECRPEDEPVEPADGGTDGGRPDGGGTDAGADAGLPDSGVPDAGVPDAGSDPQPTVIAFVTSPQVVEAGECSAAVVVETRDETGSAFPVSAPTDLVLGALPGTGFSFFSNANCQSPISQVRLAAGSSSGTFYFRGTRAGTIQVTVSATGLPSSAQSASIQPADPEVAAFLSSPQTVPAGACSALVEIEARDAYGNPSPIPQEVLLPLEVTPTGGFTFYADPACATPIVELPFAQGEMRAGFYFRGKTGGTFTLSVAETSQNAIILPVVRSGNCTMSSGSSSVNCSISPAQRDRSKTLLLFQATSAQTNPNQTTPASSAIRCSLTSTSNIRCYRNSTSGSITIRWQTAELPSGLKVQHLDDDCDDDPVTSLSFSSVARTDGTFLLVSSEHSGATLGADDLYTAALVEDDEVELEMTEDCASSWEASVQVVEWEGATVTRGVTGAMSGELLVVPGLPEVDPASTVLFFTYRASGGTTTSLCDRLLRGELTSPTSLTFSRNLSTPGCGDISIDAISWERVDLGASAQAQHLLVSMPPGTNTTSSPIAAVDTTRTLVFSTGQGLSGQGMGENDYATDDAIGAAVGRHVLTAPTTLQITRGSSLGTAQWSSTVLQIEP